MKKITAWSMALLSWSAVGSLTAQNLDSNIFPSSTATVIPSPTPRITGFISENITPVPTNLHHRRKAKPVHTAPTPVPPAPKTGGALKAIVAPPK
jgi:hypothetical protein